MATAKRKKKARKSKYADQANALMKVNDIIMHRQMALEYVVQRMLGNEFANLRPEIADDLRLGSG